MPRFSNTMATLVGHARLLDSIVGRKGVRETSPPALLEVYLLAECVVPFLLPPSYERTLCS